MNTKKLMYPHCEDSDCPAFNFFAFSGRGRDDRIIKLWDTIQDLCGEHHQYPRFITKLFWSDHLRNQDRMNLASFFMVNGICPEVSLRYYNFYLFLSPIISGYTYVCIHYHFTIYRFFSNGRR